MCLRARPLCNRSPLFLQQPQQPLPLAPPSPRSPDVPAPAAGTPGIISGPIDDEHLKNRMALAPLPIKLTEFHVENFILAALAAQCSQVTLALAELLVCPTVPDANLFVFFPQGPFFTTISDLDLEQIRARLTDAVRVESGGLLPRLLTLQEFLEHSAAHPDSEAFNTSVERLPTSLCPPALPPLPELHGPLNAVDLHAVIVRVAVDDDDNLNAPPFTGSSLVLPPVSNAAGALHCMVDTPMTAGIPALLLNDAAEPDYKRRKVAHATVVAMGNALSDSLREFTADTGSSENACRNITVSNHYQAFINAKRAHHMAAYALLSNAQRSHRLWAETRLPQLSMNEAETDAHINTVRADPRYSSLMPRK